MPGLFITFEGGEGTGKTTQLRALSVHLRAGGWNALETRIPGGPLSGRRSADSSSTVSRLP